MMTKYDLTELPTHERISFRVGERDTWLRPDGTEVDAAHAKVTTKWSGAKPAPAIGDRVVVRMNRLGAGVVVGYFIEHGWLGVYVKLDKAPAWYLKQNGRAPAMVFGAELKGNE